MARRGGKAKETESETTKTKYVGMRPGRTGVKRKAHMTFVDELLMRLEKHARNERTTCAEIVMDWIEEKLVRRPRIAALTGRTGDPDDEADESAA